MSGIGDMSDTPKAMGNLGEATSTLCAVISMLHEPVGRDSATRLFRGDPVLNWTLERLARCRGLETMAVLCWEDQLPAVEPIAGEKGAYVLAKGPRVNIPSVEAIATARKWADGWRGGLLQTCDFDLGFYGPWMQEIADKLDAEAVLLVDPSAGLVDPELIHQLIEHAAKHESAELVFSQAAPGLGGAIVRRALLDRLVSSNLHPGKLLHYLPDQPVHDPTSSDNCLPVPATVARTGYRFKLDSDRQVNRIRSATISLNGQLISSRAEELVQRLSGCEAFDSLPREIVLELNTERKTSPIFSPSKALSIHRPELSLDHAKILFEELAAVDDVRLTLAGVGDPLLAEKVFAIVAAAREAGIDTIHLETDLLPDVNLSLAQLLTSGVDVISFHVPATRPETYQAIMGMDGFVQVLENVRALLTVRQEHKRGVPVIVPVFVKCRQNLAEMEGWYDQWLRSLGCASILGPGDYAGQIPDVAVAEMAPPRRKPCARLSSRMTILSDGTVVACEQDVLGAHPLGQIGVDSIQDVYRQRLGKLRTDHAQGNWNEHALCAACKEWHRP